MFKFLLIFVLLIIFVAPLRRFLFWLLVGRQLVNEQKKQAKQTKKRKEGEITVEYVPPGDKSRFEGGQYVDYEEVKD